MTIDIGNAVRQGLAEEEQRRAEIRVKRHYLRDITFYVEDSYFLRVFAMRVAALRRRKEKVWPVSKPMFDYMVKKLPARWRFSNVEFAQKTQLPNLSFQGLIIHPVLFKF